MKKDVSLHVEHLSVNYDQAAALWDVSFSLPPGELIGIIGPNGAGKSTLLKALLGLVKPISGKVAFFNLPFKKMKKRIAYIPQKKEIDWNFPISVFDVTLMGRYGRLQGLKWYRSSDRARAMSMLELMGLKHLVKRQIRELSGGQQQRLFIARALMQEADFYFLDEPLDGVDQASKSFIMDMLKTLKKQGKTVLIVHHDLNSVKKYFDRLVILNTSLIACGTTDVVFNHQVLGRTFGHKDLLFEEMWRLSQDKQKGMC